MSPVCSPLDLAYETLTVAKNFSRRGPRLKVTHPHGAPRFVRRAQLDQPRDASAHPNRDGRNVGAQAFGSTSIVQMLLRRTMQWSRESGTNVAVGWLSVGRSRSRCHASRSDPNSDIASQSPILTSSSNTITSTHVPSLQIQGSQGRGKGRQIV